MLLSGNRPFLTKIGTIFNKAMLAKRRQFARTSNKYAPKKNASRTLHPFLAGRSAARKGWSPLHALYLAPVVIQAFGSHLPRISPRLFHAPLTTIQLLRNLSTHQTRTTPGEILAFGRVPVYFYLLSRARVTGRLTPRSGNS